MFFTLLVPVISSALAATEQLSGNGHATFYGDVTDIAKGEYPPFNSPVYGACGPKPDGAPENVEEYYMALNSAQFDPETPYGNTWGNTLCGSCVRVKFPAKQTETVVYLTDSCPSCEHGDVDLSLKAMTELTGSDDASYYLGRLPVTWEAVPCPAVMGAQTKASEYENQQVASAGDETEESKVESIQVYEQVASAGDVKEESKVESIHADLTYAVDTNVLPASFKCPAPAAPAVENAELTKDDSAADEMPLDYSFDLPVVEYTDLGETGELTSGSISVSVVSALVFAAVAFAL
ncbi:MAG: hypothetical protein SGCHY_003996 [Lobulomycetales sp.]